ncbi:MAG: hypothetical protein AVDCRST_MAG60-1845, partial [uncultured Nocardioides sp.]
DHDRHPGPSSTCRAAWDCCRDRRRGRCPSRSAGAGGRGRAEPAPGHADRSRHVRRLVRHRHPRRPGRPAGTPGRGAREHRHPDHDLSLDHRAQRVRRGAHRGSGDGPREQQRGGRGRGQHGAADGGSDHDVGRPPQPRVLPVAERSRRRRRGDRLRRLRHRTGLSALHQRAWTRADTGSLRRRLHLRRRLARFHVQRQDRRLRLVGGGLRRRPPPLLGEPVGSRRRRPRHPGRLRGGRELRCLGPGQRPAHGQLQWHRTSRQDRPLQGLLGRSRPGRRRLLDRGPGVRDRPGDLRRGRRPQPRGGRTHHDRHGGAGPPGRRRGRHRRRRCGGQRRSLRVRRPRDTVGHHRRRRTGHHAARSVVGRRWSRPHRCQPVSTAARPAQAGARRRRRCRGCASPGRARVPPRVARCPQGRRSGRGLPPGRHRPGRQVRGRGHGRRCGHGAGQRPARRCDRRLPRRPHGPADGTGRRSLDPVGTSPRPHHRPARRPRRRARRLASGALVTARRRALDAAQARRRRPRRGGARRRTRLLGGVLRDLGRRRPRQRSGCSPAGAARLVGPGRPVGPGHHCHAAGRQLDAGPGRRPGRGLTADAGTGPRHRSRSLSPGPGRAVVARSQRPLVHRPRPRDDHPSPHQPRHASRVLLRPQPRVHPAPGPHHTGGAAAGSRRVGRRAHHGHRQRRDRSVRRRLDRVARRSGFGDPDPRRDRTL